MKLKSHFKGILDEKEIELIPSSFDLVGDICIFNDFPEELEHRRKIIGEKIVEVFKNINVVCVKEKEYSGICRTPKINVIGGERRTETVHKEHGVRLKLDLEKTYFSARTSSERKRIFSQVEKGEVVLVMFSGVAPLPVVISKNTEAEHIYGIEINKSAHHYALKNLEINKIKNVSLYNGDVREILPEFKIKFDRILMPLPRTAKQFLDLAFDFVKKKGVVHLYSFLDFEEIEGMKEKIKSKAEKSGRSVEINKVVRCGQFSPGVFRICFDLIVS